jgi:hypothetical protein
LNKFYVYFLRRPDRKDPFDPDMACPFYVGKGQNGRANSHRWEAKSLLHRPGRKNAKINIIHKLWKQGLDFEIDIALEALTEQEAYEYEVEAITTYGRIDLGSGCLANLSDGGEGGSSGTKWSPEVIAKRAESLRNNGKPRGGWKLSEETKEALSKKRLGVPRPEEVRKKIGEAHRGKVVSEETRKKMSDSSARRGNPAWNRGMKNPTSSEQMKGNQLAKLITIEGRKRISETASKTHKGKVVSEETRRRMSEAKKGKRRSLPCPTPT